MPCGCGSVTPNPINCNKTATVCKGNHVIIDIGINCTPVINTSPLYGTVVLHDVNTKYYVYTHDGTDNFVDSFSYNCGSQVCTVNLTINDSIEENETLISLVASGDCEVGEPTYTWELPACATLASGYTIHDEEIQIIVNDYDPNLSLEDQICEIKVTICCGNCNTCCKCKYFYWQPPICTGNCEQEVCACPYPCTVLNPDTGNCESSCESNHTYCLQDMTTIYYGNYGNCTSGQKRNKVGIRTGSTSEIADRVYYATKTGSVNEGVNTSGQIQIGNFLEVTPLISSSFNFNVGSSAYSIIIKAVDDINGREITFEEMNCHSSNSDNYIRGLDGIYVMFEKDTPCGVIRFVCRIQYNQDFTLNVTGVALNDTNIQNLYKCKTCGQMCCGGNTGDNINVTKTCTKIDDSNYLINLYSNNSGGNWILSSFVNIQDNNGCAVVTDYQIFDETIGSIDIDGQIIDIDGQMTFNYISSSEISIKISTDGIPAPGGGFVIGYKVGDCKKYYAFQILALENQTPSNHCLGTFVFNDYLLEHNLLSDNPFYFCNTCIGTTTYCASCCENSNCQINATCSVQPVCDNGTCKCILNGVEVEPLPNGCCPECISDINCRPCVNGVLLPLPTCSNGFVLNPLTCECECECSLGRCINLLTGQCEDCPTVECTSIPNQYTCNGVAVDTTCEPCNNCVSGNCVPVTCPPNYIVNSAFNPNLPISVSNSCCIVDPCHIVQSQCNLTTITEPDHDLRLTVGYCDNNTKKVTINYGLDFEPTAVVANMTEIVWEINNTSYIGGNIILTGIIGGGGQAIDSVTSTPVPGIYFANGSGIIKNGALIIDTSLTQNKHLIITCTYRGRKKWYRLDMNSNSNACTLVECQDFNCTIPANTNSLKLGGAFMCRQVFRINDSSAEVIEWIIDGVSYILNGGIPVTPFNNYVVYYTNKLIVINCQENPNPCDCANESTCVIDISFVAMIGECEITSCDTTTYPCTCCGGNCCNESEIKFNSTIDTNGYWYVSADIFSTNPNANLPLFTDCQTLTSLSFPNEFDTTRCGNYPYLKDGLPVGIEDNSSPDLALHPVYPNIQGNDNCGCACGFTFFDCELHDFDGNTIVLKNLGENPKVCFQTDIVGNNCVDPNDRCCIGQCLELNTTSTCNTPPYFVSGYFECNYCNFHGVLHDYNLVNNPPPLGVLNNPIVITDCAGNTVNANWVSYNGDPLFGQLHVVNFLLGFNQTPYDGDCNVDFQNHGIDISCGSITVSYTDDNGCQAEDFVINKFCIEEDCDLSFILNPNCNENQLEVIISGGISPYNYSYEYGIFNAPYDNNGTSNSDTIVLPLEDGEPFSIKITDSKGCQFEVVNRVILPCPVECEPPVLDVSFECINNMLRFVTVGVISSVGCGETPVATVSISTSTLPAPLVISGPIVIDEFGSGIGSIQVTTNILVSTITSITVSMACGNSGNTDCLTELIFTDIVCESPNNKTCEVLPKSAVTAVIAFDSSTQAISNDYLPTQKQFAINLVNEIFYSNLSRVAFIDFSSKNDSFLNFQTNNTNLINAINGTSVNNGNSDLRCPLFKAVEALTNYSTTNQKFIYLITDVPAVGESQSCASCQLISNCTGFPTYSQSYILPNDITLVIIANNGNMTALNTFSTFNNNEAIVYYANQSFIADTNFANGVFKNSFINSNSTCIDIEDITYPVTCNCINANINYDCVNGQCVENVNGQYVTLLDCQNNCVPVMGFDCGNCNEEIEGGIFSTATECQTECANCTEPNFRSSLGLCYVATNEGYAYTSLNSSHTSLQVKFLVDITNPNYIGNEHEFDNMYLGYGACISSCTNYVQLGVGVLVGGYMEYTTTNLISLNSFESIYAIFSDSAGTIYSLSDGNYKFVLIEGACTNEVSVTVDCTTPLTLCEIPESPKSETTLSSNRTGVCGTKLTGNNCVSTGCDVTFSKLGEFMSNESSCLLELKYYIQGSSDTLAPLPNQADCAGAINNTLSSIYAKNIIPSNFINLDSSVTEAQLINEINSVFLIWGNTLERVLGKTIVFDRTLDKNEADVYVSLCDFQLMADIVDYEEFDTLFGQYGLTHYNSYGCYNAILVQREIISLKINSNFNWNPPYEWSIDTRPPLNRISLLWCLLHELAKSFGICDIQSGQQGIPNQLMNPSNIYTKRYYDIFDNMDLLNDTELIKCILYKYGN